MEKQEFTRKMEGLEKVKDLSYITDLFEDVKECVYISDIKTHELIYMNRRLREDLGFSAHADYAGKKCYEVLQRRDSPCSFCTNAALQGEKRVSWTQKNPVLQKNFLIKNGVFTHEGRTYRIEVAVDMEEEGKPEVSYYYAHGESILNECLAQIFSTSNAEESLQRILSYLGNMFQCGCVYIFELDGRQISSTYGWRDGRETSQKLLFQSMSSEEVEWWLCELKKCGTVTVSDLETIRRRHPTSYAALKAQNISRLCVSSISVDGELTGFIGMGDPSADLLQQIPPLLKMVERFIVFLMKRRDELSYLKTLSYRDQLTGARNQNDLWERQDRLQQCDSIGVLLCDIRGATRINELFGQETGDQILRQCYQMLQDSLQTSLIYRIGDDEFLALYQNADKYTLLADVDYLRNKVSTNDYRLDVGCDWSDQKPFSIRDMIDRANCFAVQNKEDVHVSAQQTPDDTGREQMTERQPELLSHPLHAFLKDTYFDPESFIQSIAQQNTTSYFYMGDLQKDLFYISDNMRDDFGFSHNVVPALLSLWEQRISSETAREIYRQDIRSMMEEKRMVHDLRYQVKDVSGNNVWIRCYGIMKWNEDKTKPLFFSGRVTRQDNEFMVDPTTNFYFTQTMLHLLDTARSEKKKFTAIGFSFNHITEINSTRGRTYSDYLIQSIARSLAEEFAGQMTFYRLEGMRCIALMEEDKACCKETLVQKIVEIVSYWYATMGISVQHPCSFALMEYPCGHFVPSEFLDTMLTLIRTAKRNPRRSYMTYSPEDMAAAKEASDMELALNRDVMNDMEHFRIVVQPIVSSKTGRICGGEVLLRWEYRGKTVSPAVFIPILEKENMIQKAGRWVFEKAVRACQLLCVYAPDFYLSFNVSLQQLSDSQFPDFMRDTLMRYKLDGSHLLAEMTESCMDEHPELLIRFVDICTSMGVRIALDDFGSGYSSLKMLLRYPSNVIKLDRSLLSEMMESDHKLNFISSIVYACHRFGKTVCMEGVETAEQAVQIREAGCDMVQGYYFHRPMELDDLYQLLCENQEGDKKASRMSVG